jgi:hypothetical protein
MDYLPNIYNATHTNTSRCEVPEPDKASYLQLSQR